MAKIARPDNPVAQPCPDLPIYGSITIGQTYPSWQKDRQQYQTCQQQHKALIDQIASKERAIESGR